MGLTKVTYSMIEGASVNVLDYGATGDGTTDDTAAFQAAIDYASSLENGGSVVIPDTDAFYSVGTLEAKDNVTVIVPNRATRIVCDKATGTFLDTVCWKFGGYDFNFNTPTAYAINNISIGDSTVTFTTAGNSSNFQIGDVIWVETIANYTAGTYTVPVFYQMNVVTNVSAGVVTLYYPIQSTYSSCQARRLTRNGAGNPNAIQNFKLIGGTWENAITDGAFGVSGGIINSEISPDVVIAAFGCLYGNGFAHITSNIKTMKTTKTPIGLALGSHNTTLNVESLAVNNSALLDRIIELSESTRDNKLTFNTITAADDVKSVVQIIASRRNEITINSVICPSITLQAVEIWGPAYPIYTGLTPTTDNIVTINNVHCTSVLYPVTYSGSASPNTYVENNKVTVNLNAAYNSSTPAASPAYQSQRNITNVKSLSYWKAKFNELYAVGTSVSQASPYSQTFYFYANTLKAGDEMRIALRGIATGATGTKTVTITFAGSTVYSGTIPTGSKPFDIQSTVYVFDNTVAVGNTGALIDTSSAAVDFGVTGLNFTTTQYDLVINITCAAAGGDLVSMREISMQFYRPYSNDLYLYGR